MSIETVKKHFIPTESLCTISGQYFHRQSKPETATALPIGTFYAALVKIGMQSWVQSRYGKRVLLSELLLEKHHAHSCLPTCRGAIRTAYLGNPSEIKNCGGDEIIQTRNSAFITPTRFTQQNCIFCWSRDRLK